MKWLEPIGLLLGYALVALLPYIRKSFQNFLKNKGDYLSKNLKVRRQIDDIINEIRIYMQANRCMLMEFSNTEKSTGGFPFEFASITYEHTDANLVHIKSSVQRLPISNMLDWLIPLSDERHTIFQDDDLKNADTIRFQMHNLSLSSIICFKVTNNLKNGVVIMHFNQPYNDDWRMLEGLPPHPDLAQILYQCNRIYELMKTLKK